MINQRGFVSKAVGVVAITSALVGCTAAADGSGRPTSQANASDKVSAVERLAVARGALQTVSGYRAKGTLSIGGQQTQVDLTVGPAGGHGILTTPDGTTIILDQSADSRKPETSAFYITAPASYWLGAGQSEPESARFADRPVLVPESAAVHQLYVLADQNGLTQLVFTAAGQVDSAYSVDAPPFDGQPAVIVKFGGQNDAEMTVQAGTTQYPLRLTAPKAELDFSGFDVAPRIRIPAPGQALSLPG